MRAREIEGMVTVRFRVDRTGRAHDVEAFSQSGLEFVEPAKRVVEQLRFEPARLGSVAVEQAVPWFEVPFRLRPRQTSARGEPGGTEVLLRAAVQRYYPELFRQESARPPHVFLVVDERGNVVRHALAWTRPERFVPETFMEKFPDLPRAPELGTSRSTTSIRSGIPGGRDIRVYWAVLKDAARPAGSVAWGPFPLDALMPAPPSIQRLRQAVSELHPDLLERASAEPVWFLMDTRGEVIATGRGSARGRANPWSVMDPGAGVIMVGNQPAADGGSTQVLWVTSASFAPSDLNVIAGTVRDASGNPVPGAVILFRDRYVGAVSGSDGGYLLNAAGLPAGSYTIVARHPVTNATVTSQVTVQPGSRASADLVLPSR
jgi:hypothetical protein